MSRYIDAEYIKAVMINDRLMQGNAEFNLYAKQVEIQVNAMPSIDVVRCKDCKYWIGHIADDDGFDGEDECRWRDSEAPNADDYCSYGERKEKRDE